ncbi:heavy metal-associated isoprenylated plant protein 16-like [Hevea brasiliensis]|uniref:heavy metal-associated isoprenylated plant protein 16-like n=1 Tax=Hevea brasiliensis TaxID=3981 RepID=UPI0025DC02A3|nr:heavy metal-associated isoprenylated plant protein 16-like [Hevea brasiliensis]
MSKQKMLIKVSTDGDCKKRSRALEIVVSVSGVQSVALVEKDKNQIEVIGEGVDPVKLTCSLRKKLAYAELISVSPVEEKKDEKKDDEKVECYPAWSYGMPIYVQEQYDSPCRTCSIM